MLSWVVNNRNRLSAHGGAYTPEGLESLAASTAAAALELLREANEDLFGGVRFFVQHQGSLAVSAGLSSEANAWNSPALSGRFAVETPDGRLIDTWPWMTAWKGQDGQSCVGFLNEIRASTGPTMEACYLEPRNSFDLHVDSDAAAWLSAQLDAISVFVSNASVEESDSRFTIQTSIGSGGAGTVFLARQHSLDRDVALKVLHADAGVDALRRFEREGHLLSSGDHPSLIRVFDRGHTAEGHPYLVMEWVDGADLSQLAAVLRHWRSVGVCLNRGAIKSAARCIANARLARSSASEIASTAPPLSIDDASSDTYYTSLATLFAQAASALNELHSATPPVIHRDIKPANLMVTRDGERLIVMDLGAAVELVGAEAGQTLVVSLAGTVEYWAPEQRHLPPVVDARTDVYSLGVSLAELVDLAAHGQGHMPDRSTLGVHLNGRRVGFGAPRALARVIARATNVNPTARYDTADAFRLDLDAFATGKPLPADGLRERLMVVGRSLVRRHMVSLSVVAGALACGVLAFDYLASASSVAHERSLASDALSTGQRHLALQHLSAVLTHEPDEPQALSAINDILHERNWMQHGEPIVAATFSPDGASVLTVSTREAVVWDVMTGLPQASTALFKRPVVTASYTDTLPTQILIYTESTIELFDTSLNRIDSMNASGVVKNVMSNTPSYCDDEGWKPSLDGEGLLRRNSVAERPSPRRASPPSSPSRSQTATDPPTDPSRAVQQSRRPPSCSLESAPGFPVFWRASSDRLPMLGPGCLHATSSAFAAYRLTVADDIRLYRGSFFETDVLGQTLRPRGHLVSCLANSPTFRHLALAGPEGLVVIGTDTLKELELPIDAHGRTKVVDFSPDGVKMVTGYEDGSVRLWILGQSLRPWHFVNGQITSSEEARDVSLGLTGADNSSRGHLTDRTQRLRASPSWAAFRRSSTAAIQDMQRNLDLSWSGLQNLQAICVPSEVTDTEVMHRYRLAPASGAAASLWWAVRPFDVADRIVPDGWDVKEHFSYSLEQAAHRRAFLARTPGFGAPPIDDTYSRVSMNIAVACNGVNLLARATALSGLSGDAAIELRKIHMEMFQLLGTERAISPRPAPSELAAQLARESSEMIETGLTEVLKQISSLPTVDARAGAVAASLDVAFDAMEQVSEFGPNLLAERFYRLGHSAPSEAMGTFQGETSIRQVLSLRLCRIDILGRIVGLSSHKEHCVSPYSAAYFSVVDDVVRGKVPGDLSSLRQLAEGQQSFESLPSGKVSDSFSDAIVDSMRYVEAVYGETAVVRETKRLALIRSK